MISSNKFTIALSSFFLLSVFIVFFYFFYYEKSEFKCKNCNVVMISLSNISANHMSLYGYERDTTPNLNKWVEDAVVFENAFTQSSWTLPVAVSILTSLYPYSHGIMDRTKNNQLSKEIITLPEFLKDNGYKTAAFTGGLDYYPLYSYMRGIDDYEINPQFSEFEITLKQSKNWIENNAKDKFFLLIHGYDTHCPFTPPNSTRNTFGTEINKPENLNEELCFRGYKESDGDIYNLFSYKNKIEIGSGVSQLSQVSVTQEDIDYLEARYDEEILSVDKQIVDFLNSFPKSILNNTIFVIFSDHGEMFGRNGRFGRTGSVRGTLYDEVIKVPLIVKIPGQKGKVVKEMSELIDIMPTIIDILGIKFSNNQMQGQNLVSLMKGENKNRKRFSYTGTVFGVSSKQEYNLIRFDYKTINESIRDMDWKLIHEIFFDDEDNIIEESYELYNIKNDKHEQTDVSSKNLPVFDVLKTELSVWRNTATAFDNSGNKTQALPSDLIEAAREKGYW